MSTGTKLTKGHISKVIQWGGSFRSWLAKVGRKL